MSFSSLSIPPLISGGVMLSYRCTNRCRHCLYRCSPDQPDEWLSPEQAEQIFAALAAEPRLSGIHLAGGEATLRFDLLEQVIGIAVAAGVAIDYLETNAWWARDRDQTRQRLERLRDAGLPALLVSVSLFHHEFVPFRSTRNCIEVAREVLGPGGVLVYMPHIYQLLGQLPEQLSDRQPHAIEEVCELLGLAPDDPRIASSYGVIPGGRACSALRTCFRAHPAEAFRGQICRGDLMSTSHFHIDPYGHLFTGLCAGLVAATVDDLHPQITPDRHPVMATLCHHGPHALMERAMQDHGFIPRAGGYISKCDLCLDVRTSLHRSGDYPELQPDSFYAAG
jgi:hypothetical protein